VHLRPAHVGDVALNQVVRDHYESITKASRFIDYVHHVEN
jgi:hypothetical protein